jgi:Ca2+-binding RTX toxin-like protein
MAFTPLTITVANGGTQVDPTIVRFNENTGSGVLIGTVNNLVQDATYAWSVQGGTTQNAQGRYRFQERVDGTGKKVIDVYLDKGGEVDFNFEAASFHDIILTGTKDNAVVAEGSFKIQLANVNETPSDLTLTNSSNPSFTFAENVPVDTVVGQLGSTDPDTSSTWGRVSHRYSIANDPNGLFKIERNATTGAWELKVAKALDYDALPQNQKYLDLQIVVTDATGTGLSRTEPFRINLTNDPSDDPVTTNNPPTAPVVQGGTVATLTENGGGVASVATVQSTDDGVGGTTLSYELVTNPGNLFTINQTNGTISFDGGGNYESTTQGLQVENPGTAQERKYFNVQVRARESGTNGQTSGTTTVKVYLNDVNEALTDATYTVNAMNENAAVNTAVSTNVTVTDPDTVAANRNFRYQLVDQNGNAVTATIFSVDATSGAITVGPNGLPDVAAATDVNLWVKITDKGGAPGSFSIIEQVTVRVNPVTPGTPVITNVPDPAPVLDTAFIQPFLNATVMDQGQLKLVVSGFKGHGEVSNYGTATYNVQEGTLTYWGTADQVTTLLRAIRFNPTDKAPGAPADITPFTINVTDNDGNSADETVNVTATAVNPPTANQKPTDISFSGVTSFVEMPLNGTTLGTLGATDPDNTGGFVYSIVNPDGRFQIVGNELKVANGSLFDFETRSTHTVTVRVTDKNGTGLSYDEAFTFGLTDGVDIWTGTSGNNTLRGTAGPDKLYGLKGKDKLYGGTGDDVIYGGEGNDTLYGQKGKNAFVFDAKLGTSSSDRKVNFDAIKDFVVKDDSIWLDDKIFKNTALKKLGKGASEVNPKQLTSKFFKISDKAKDKDDYIIYNKKTGVLSYDADGSGSKAAIEIAQLSKNLKMTYKDFFIM